MLVSLVRSTLSPLGRLTRNLSERVIVEVEVGANVDVSSVHRAHAILQLRAIARVEVLFQGREAIDEQLHLGIDLARNRRHSSNIEVDFLSARLEYNIEECGVETRVGLARIERL